MKKLHENETGRIIYEDKKLIIGKDKYQYIITEKDTKYVPNPSYIVEKHNVLWEICECRRCYKKESPKITKINEALLYN